MRVRAAALLAAVGSLASAACAGPAGGEPEPRRELPSPGDAGADPASAAPTTRGPDAERLASICLATPWVTDGGRGPQPIPPEHRERLDALEKDCRDVSPELPPARFASTTDIPTGECHYGIARIYFELGHHPEAARWFHRVIVEEKDHELGAFAAQMYLGSLDALARQSTPPRAECRRLAIDEAARFVGLYCARPETQDACENLRRMEAELASRE